MQRSAVGHSALRVQSRQMQYAISSVFVPRAVVLGSGQVVESAALMRLPQIPWVMFVDESRKHTPRHCVLRGVVSPAGVSVIVGLHASPSASRVRFAAFGPQKPVRTLQTVPP